MASGSIALKIQYHGLLIPITVIDEKYELCGTETGLTCPLEAGSHSVKFANEVRSEAPGVSVAIITKRVPACYNIQIIPFTQNIANGG